MSWLVTGGSHMTSVVVTGCRWPVARDIDWRMRHSVEEMVRSVWEALLRAEKGAPQ